MSEPIRVGPMLDALKAAFDEKPYDVPVIEWECGALAATTPEPHIALSAEYIADNDIDIDLGYVMTLALQVGVENGYRIARKEETERLRLARPLRETDNA